MLTLAPGASNNSVGDLVTAFVAALNTIKSSECATRPQDEDEVRRIIAEFDALGGSERDQVAHTLTQLWDAFTERFDGLHGFLAAEFHERFTYVKQLERACERMARYRQGAIAHYYQATILMLAYIKAILQQQSLGSRVTEAVHRGRVLAREGPPLQSTQTVEAVQVPSPTPAGSLRLASVAAGGVA